jgi:hydroxypyruvate isomerase
LTAVAKLSVCVEIFFGDLPYAERLKKIAALGFTAYEFWFPEQRFDGAALIPENKSFDDIAQLNARYGLTATDFVFNHPDGGVKASLISGKDRGKLRDEIGRVMGLAKKIGCTRLICGSGNKVPGLSHEQAMDNMTAALAELAPVCAREGITLILEAFNSRVNHPDYFLDDPHDTVEVLSRVNHPNVKMLYDIYHMQIMDGNIVAFLRKNIKHIGHFHIAGVPGRNEPVPCELDYPFILKEIEALGYTGYFGLEYWPLMDHAESLKKTRAALGA